MASHSHGSSRPRSVQLDSHWWLPTAASAQQWLLVHCWSALQFAPEASRKGTQLPALQPKDSTQSLFELQLFRHTFDPHTYGAQLACAARVHCTARHALLRQAVEPVQSVSVVQ